MPFQLHNPKWIHPFYRLTTWTEALGETHVLYLSLHHYCLESVKTKFKPLKLANYLLVSNDVEIL